MKKEVVCPKCHSDQITSQKKGFNTGKILLRGFLLGATDANSTEIVCLMCGAKFIPGQGGIKLTDENGLISFDKNVIQDQPRNGVIDFYILGVIILLIIIVLILK